MTKTTLLLLSIAILIFSCSSKEEMPEPEEGTKFAFAGKWLGNWSDSLFPTILASAVVRKVGTDKYAGVFYFSTNGNASYTPCCGGDTDGTVTFETKGDSVLNFLFIQNAPEYRGGCPGTYEGAGVIDKVLDRLIISFTGKDCDGFHDNGKIVWRLDI